MYTLNYSKNFQHDLKLLKGIQVLNDFNSRYGYTHCTNAYFGNFWLIRLGCFEHLSTTIQNCTIYKHEIKPYSYLSSTSTSVGHSDLFNTTQEQNHGTALNPSAGKCEQGLDLVVQ